MHDTCQYDNQLCEMGTEPSKDKPPDAGDCQEKYFCNKLNII
jgi:hypothetical protein